MVSHLMLVAVVFGICGQSRAAIVGGTCNSNADCSDPHSVCRPHRCDSYICVCEVGYVIDGRTKTCKKVSLLGDSCNVTADCLPRNTDCNINVCKCKPNFTPYDNFWCVSQGVKPLNDTCNPGDTCIFGAQCNNVTGRCSCSAGHQPWAGEDRWYGYPTSQFILCQKSNNSLNLCNFSIVALPKRRKLLKNLGIKPAGAP